jgi:hypothetical protein
MNYPAAKQRGFQINVQIELLLMSEKLSQLINKKKGLDCHRKFIIIINSYDSMYERNNPNWNQYKNAQSEKKQSYNADNIEN